MLVADLWAILVLAVVLVSLGVAMLADAVRFKGYMSTFTFLLPSVLLVGGVTGIFMSGLAIVL